MKKLFIRLVAVVSFAIMMVGCGAGDSYTNAVSNQSMIVTEFNAYHVMQKSGMFDELISAAKAALISENAPAYAISLLDDLLNSGVDVKAPMYAYAYMLDNNNVYMGLVAKTYDVEKLNALIAFIESENRETLNKVVLNGSTLIDLDSDIAFGYNENAVVLGAIETLHYYGKHPHVDVKELISEALANTVNGNSCDKLPSFAGSDIACRMDVSPILDFMKGMNGSSNNQEIAAIIASFEGMRDAKFNFAGNFVKGSIDCEFEWSGLPKVGYKAPTCSNDNLKYVSKDAWFVANLPFSGKDIIEEMNKALENNANCEAIDTATTIAMGKPFINIKSIMALVGPMISSVDGDITIALNKLANLNFNVPTIDAVAIVPVEDKSIMSLASGAIASIPGARSVDDNIYQISADGVVAYIGQKKDLLFASAPAIIEKKSKPATEANWYSEVKGSYGYVVFNAASIFACPEIRSEIANECSRDELFYVNRFIDLFDYAVISIPSLESVSYRLVLKNDSENALKQMFDIVKPLFMKEIMDL